MFSSISSLASIFIDNVTPGACDHIIDGLTAAARSSIAFPAIKASS